MTPKILSTLPGYRWPDFTADALAGLTVALVALPLSIAIAIASGATPTAGIVTAVIGGFIVSALGGSRVQIGGPTGAFIVVVYAVQHDHGTAGLLLATMMAGCWLVIAALLRLGRFIHLVPEPVVEGFTIGIAIVIAASQIKDLFGLPVARVPADFLPKLAALWAARGGFSVAALVTGLAAILLIVALRRAAPRWPGLLLAVAIVSLGAAWWGGDVATVAARYGPVASTWPALALPPVDGATLLSLLPASLTIAFLAGIESLLSAMVADRMVDGRHRSNAELLAQGVANVVSPLAGGLPVTGAIARTATNVRAGGRTPVAGMAHALFILLAVLAAGNLIGALALPALAGLLLVTAWNMSEPHRWPERWRLAWSDRLVLLLTMGLTVFADLTIAIVAGTLLGLVLRCWRGGEAGLRPPQR